uniref:Uncharacterized protein n=1 Tax=Triticum urartu TaxID=4572 RepID=A0A8R7QNS2_TRIUA
MICISNITCCTKPQMQKHMVVQNRQMLMLEIAVRPSKVVLNQASKSEPTTPTQPKTLVLQDTLKTFVWVTKILELESIVGARSNYTRISF